MRTLLFDIDGTLLISRGGGLMAVRRALQTEFGITDPWVDISFSGRTDRYLLRELLAGNGLPQDAHFQGRLRQRYAALFPECLVEVGGDVLPGVMALLERLSQDARVRVAVMTGNLPETATRKLEHFELLPFVEWISAGDLDIDRNALARRTSDMIRRRYGDSASNDVIVIGDTPFDIECGHAIGAPVVAVCTGSHPRDELASYKPLSIWDDFSQWQAVFELLVSDDPARRHGRVLRLD